MLKASDVASSNKIFLNNKKTKKTETFYAVDVEVDMLPPIHLTHTYTNNIKKNFNISLR